MSENSKIEWCDSTFNPWEGCTKWSPGCLHCYAETRNARFGGGTAPNWGKGKPRRRTSAANWKLPLKWNREVLLAKKQDCGCVVCYCEDEEQCQGCGARNCGNHKAGEIPNPRSVRPKVFCASLADWLDDEVPLEWLADLLDLIRLTPNLDWLMLTKRPENWGPRIRSAMTTIAMDSDTRANMQSWVDGKPPQNIWIGTTVEDQARADERIPHLLDIPAKARFLSCEPLLESLDLTAMFEHRAEVHNDTGIHWVIVGGESGPGCRPFNPEWARSLRDQCQSAGVPFFFKQMGGTRKPFPAIPDDLMIREFPQS